MKNHWISYDEGKHLGETGTENGVITRDEAFSQSARITLESIDTNDHYAITFGIYGYMVHTSWYAALLEAELAYFEAQKDLAKIVGMIPYNNDPDVDRKIDIVLDLISDFTKKHG